MSHKQFLQQICGVLLVMLVLVGCSAPAATPVAEAPTSTATPEPLAATPTPIPPPATPTPIPPTSTPIPPTPTVIPPLTVTLGPDPGPKGDPDGSGLAFITLDLDKGEICFELSASGITLPARATHIHEGRAGENGPIVVGLIPPDASGTAKGCKSVESAIVNAIQETPSDYHILVHTMESGIAAGALRGQLP